MGRTFNQRYKDLMCGGTVTFNESEVIELLYYLDYYHINTLLVQSNPKESTNVWRKFTCRVDEATARGYFNEQNSEMRIV